MLKSAINRHRRRVFRGGGGGVVRARVLGVVAAPVAAPRICRGGVVFDGRGGDRRPR